MTANGTKKQLVSVFEQLPFQKVSSIAFDC